jgi:hypothetical protein
LASKDDDTPPFKISARQLRVIWAEPTSDVFGLTDVDDRKTILGVLVVTDQYIHSGS